VRSVDGKRGKQSQREGVRDNIGELGNLNERLKHRTSRCKGERDRTLGLRLREEKEKKPNLPIARQGWGGLSSSLMDHSATRWWISKTAKDERSSRTFRGHAAGSRTGQGWE
jgi:hypothetical protein